VIDDRPAEPLVRKALRAVRSGRGGYVAIMAAQALARRRRPGADAEAFFARAGVPTLRVRELAAPATLAFLEGSEPTCVFRCGFGIIREPLLSLAPQGVISFHHGDIRRVRGRPVAFWEMVRGDREVGVTIQVLAEELDAGRVVLERRVPIDPHDTWSVLERRVFERSTGMLREACHLLDRPGFVPETVPREELGEVYTLPSLRTWSGLQIRTRRHR
jgi:methionyl-tRNA formyltransferase